MNTGTNNFSSLDTLTTGIDATGMTNYVDQLKIELLDTVKEKINDVAELQAALDKGWQGNSLDKFKEHFNSMTEQICTDLQAEYDDLVARLSDLQSAYFNVDNNLIQE